MAPTAAGTLLAQAEPFPLASLEPAAPQTPIIINEILFRSEPNNARLEYIELFNPSVTPLPLSLWALRGAVEYEFPAGIEIEAGGFLVIAEDPAAVRSRFGVNALGPFAGNLSADGEEIVLYDARAVIVDAVTYGYGFPWPIGGELPLSSLQLANPRADNGAAGSWRATAPTPRAVNQPRLENLPPAFVHVEHVPARPVPGQTVTVRVQVADTDGVMSVRLGLQIVTPGAYIALTDPEYITRWEWLPMQETGDGTYSLQIPTRAGQATRTLVRYRIEATDGAGNTARAPAPDDPQPNFAWFTDAGPAPWTGSPDGTSSGRFTADFARMRPISVYHLLAKPLDVADALFMPPSTRPTGYTGNEELWRGTLVAHGVVYDHIRFRPRGESLRFATGKTDWRIEMLQAHPLQTVDDYGYPRRERWNTLNLSGALQMAWTGQRGEAGLFEALSYSLFRLAGVPAPQTHFVHLRVVTAATEVPVSQYAGDFWGIYLAIEQVDGRFLDERDLPDGNIYKVEYSGTALDHLSRQGPADGSDWAPVAAAMDSGTGDLSFWREQIDLANYFSYRAVVEAARHYDIDGLHNSIFYFHSPTARWVNIPWDTEKSWYETPHEGRDRLSQILLAYPELQLAYESRLRELRDLLLNPEQLGWLIAEHTARINTPAAGVSMVDANQARWDYDPIMSSRYVDPARSWPGAFYAAAPDGSFAGIVALMSTFAGERLRWIDATLLDDGDIPETPGLTYAGTPGYAADGLRFEPGPFSDPQGAHSFAALQWRVAEVTPAAQRTRFDQPLLYEATASWQSAEMSTIPAHLIPPAGVVQAGRTYRVRMRYRDNTGRWSHWSAPLEFVAGEPARAVQRGLEVSEIMYHPRAWANLPAEALEFVELVNRSSATLDLTGVHLAGAVEGQFERGLTLDSGKRVVLASNPAALLRRSGVMVAGRFSGQLANEGEPLILTDAWGRVMFETAWDDNAPWPAGASGAGYSLVYEPAAGPLNSPHAWRASTVVGGSPGAADPAPVLITEVLLFPEAARSIEIYNPLSFPAEIGMWGLSFDDVGRVQYRLPASAQVPARGYAAFPISEMTPVPVWPVQVSQATTTRVTLLARNEDGGPGLYEPRVWLGPLPAGTSAGRYIDSAGRTHFVAQAALTLGTANAGPRVAPVVISALRLRGATGDGSFAFVELTNHSEETVALYAPGPPSSTWQVFGGYFSLPYGLELAPGERLLIVEGQPEEFCGQPWARNYRRVLGPLSGFMSPLGQRVTLLQPMPTSAEIAYTAVDSITYTPVSPWPPEPGLLGTPMQRVDMDAFGDDPAVWTNGWLTPELPPTTVTQPALCSFVAQRGVLRTVIRWTLTHPAGTRHEINLRLLAAPTSSRETATVLLETNLQAQYCTPLGGSPETATVCEWEQTAAATMFTYYWLEMAGGSAPQPLGQASTEIQYTHLYLPVAGDGGLTR